MNGTFHVRAWGAVWAEDGPVAEVRDMQSLEEYDAIKHSADFRWWALQRMDLESKLDKSDHTGGKCAPGKPCDKCQERAPASWFRWGKRAKERIFRAAKAQARQDTDYWSAAEWGERRGTLEAAVADARGLGWPFVCEMDGHGRRLAWIDVAP